MKKIISLELLVSLLLIATTSTMFAEEIDSRGGFGALVYTPSTADGKIEGYKLEGNSMIGIVAGAKKIFSDSLGGYSSFDISMTAVDETGTSSDTIYGYRIWNVGVTYSPFDSLILLAGIGVSFEFGEMSYYGTHNTTKEVTKNMNFHTGIAYNIANNYGAMITYNTASSSVGIGIMKSF